MRTPHIACSLVALSALALGCKSNTSQVLVEQEARMLEDEVYHLEAQLEACCRAKEAAEQEAAALRRQLGGAAADDRLAPSSTSPRSRAPARRETPPLEAPTIELPEASDTPPAELMPGQATPAHGAPGAAPPAEIPPGDELPAAFGGQATRLMINRRLTGGMDRDGTGGDEGIMVMAELRDDRGRLINTPGAVSVVVMDPAQPGDAARVARWDFQAHQFADHFKTSLFGRGLQYNLAWPEAPPQNRDLVVFVRYVAEDGTRLTGDAPLRLRLASDAPRALAEHTVSPNNDAAEEAADPRAKPAAGPRRQARARPEWSPHR